MLYSGSYLIGMFNRTYQIKRNSLKRIINASIISMK